MRRYPMWMLVWLAAVVCIASMAVRQFPRAETDDLGAEADVSAAMRNGRR